MPAFAIAVGQIFRNVDILAPRQAALVILMLVSTSWWQYSVISRNLLAEENNCAPGDRFTAAQKVQMVKFLNWREFDVKVSVARKASDVLSVMIWLFLGLFTLFRDGIFLRR